MKWASYLQKRLLMLLTLFSPLVVLASESSATQKRTFVLTLPKSGTHLLKKILPMIMDREPSVQYFTNIDQDPFNPPYIPDDQYFIFNHIYPGFDYHQRRNDTNYIKVLLIRDPRDAIISFAHWLPRNADWGPWTPKEMIRKFKQLSLEERISQSILFPDAYLGLHLFCKKAVEWMEDPSVFVCRFEELVGPQGGGDRKVQEEAIRTLAEHLGYPLTQNRIAYIADNLFGNTFTFHEGKIGSWHYHFKEHHKKLFKDVMGQELIKMGYAQDNNW